MNIDMKISPNEAACAIALLGRYVNERLVALGLGSGDQDTPVTDHHLDSTVEAVRMMDELYTVKEEMQKQAKSPLEKGYDYLRFTIVPKLMETDDVTSLTVAGVGRVNLMDDVQVRVASKERLQEWLVEHDLEDMIQQTVHAQTLTAFVRRRVKEAGELPPETVITYKPITRAQITRSAA